MTSILKNVYVGKLYNIFDEYNNTSHITIEMKPVDVKSSTYFDFNKEEDPKFKVNDHVRISKHKNIFSRRLHSTLV